MYNNIKDEIEFSKKVTLHRPKKKVYKRRNLPQKILKLVYFFLILFILYKAGIYAIECYVSFCHGTDHKPIEQIMEEFKESTED